MECSTEVGNARKQKPHKAFKMTVEDIEFKSLGVSWICRAYFSSSLGEEDKEGKNAQPKFKIEGEALSRVRMLNVFEPCTLQIGDRNFYTMQEDDLVMMKPEWKRLQKEQLYKDKSKKEEKKVTKMELGSPEEVGLDEDNSSDFEDVEDDGVSDTASVSSAENIESGRQGGSAGGKKKGKSQAGLMTKVLKKKKLKKTKKNVVAGLVVVKPGDRVVTETLATRSEVEVVWQVAFVGSLLN